MSKDKKSYLDIIIFAISAGGEKSHYLVRLSVLIRSDKYFVFPFICDASDGKVAFH